MPKCSKCGQEVKKLAVHSITKEEYCIRCMPDDGMCHFTDEEVNAGHEKRSNVRIPVAISMDFSVGDNDSQEIKFPAVTVDLSRSGICFAWEQCSNCTGYTENCVNENCLFYTNADENREHKPLKVKFTVSKDNAMELDAYVIYVLKEEDLGLEYVGAKFVDTTNRDRRVLEKILIKHGKKV